MKEIFEPLGKRVRVFFMDEARFGQQGTLTRVWARRGSRPTTVKQTRYEWVYLYGAVEPETGESIGWLAPYVNTAEFNRYLRVVSERLGPDEHAVLIMDQAGWHVSGRVERPENIWILFLPPYSPELNPIENLWGYLKSHYLSNRAYRDYEHLLEAGTDAWNAPDAETIRSVCRCTYLERAVQP